MARLLIAEHREHEPDSFADPIAEASDWLEFADASVGAGHRLGENVNDWLEYGDIPPAV
jgi:hypothetical protein